MKRTAIFSTTLAMLLAGAAWAFDEDAVTILKAADEATKNVESVSYDAVSYGTGSLAVRIARMKGHVDLATIDGANLLGAQISAAGSYFLPNKEDGVKAAFAFAYDGETMRSLDQETKTLTEASGNNAPRIMGPGGALRMIEYSHPTPFQDEINAALAEVEGRIEVGGVLCDVIYVEYGGQFGDSKARWYFGVEDHLPRGVERLGEYNGRPSAQVLTLRNVKPNVKLAAKTFTLAAPEGVTVKTFAAPKPAPQPTLISVGETAPEWTLADPEGESHSLADYRGRVVVMDFWATWCGPCKKAMPSVQKLHENFEGQPVSVIGINCWERGGDPVQYMEDQGYTYGLLLEADEVATTYNVSGIPTFYVIGVNGEIIYNAVGFSGEAEFEEIALVIAKHLEENSK